MASLNLSTNGAAIAKSYQTVINSPPSSGAAAASATYGQWAIFSVTAPLVSAFQQDGGKESVLKVQSTGEGELVDMVEDLSDGRIQFAFVKAKDPKTSLPKYALIGWCGEGVPERTKGYFASHQAAVAKILHGYHIQISARSDRDLTPESILQKVSDASGADYSGTSKVASNSAAPPPVSNKKPVFTATPSGVAKSGFNPLAGRRTNVVRPENSVDEDGWGDDAPPVTRTQLEKVESAYKPTKVDIRQLTSQKPEQTRLQPASSDSAYTQDDVVKGGYQPIGKVDIAAIRRQATQDGRYKADHPAPVKGAYEPIGKVDIAEIRARAAPQSEDKRPMDLNEPADENVSGSSNVVSQLSNTSQTTGRLAELPKPKVANRFGTSNAVFGTKATTSSQFGIQSTASSVNLPPVGAGRTFAESAGKSPAQLWAEKKAAQGGSLPTASSDVLPMPNEEAAGWKSGYSGKKWAPVQPVKPELTMPEGDGEVQQQGLGEVSIARETRETNVPVLPISPSVPDVFNKPTSSPDVVPSATSLRLRLVEVADDSPTPAAQYNQAERQSLHGERDDEIEPGSPVRIAMPVARGPEDAAENVAGVETDTTLPSIEHDLDEESIYKVSDARKSQPGSSHMEDDIKTTFSDNLLSKHGDSKHAIAQYDYEKAEDNELELKEGEHITNIKMVDPDWWMGQNSQGETGLFPSNYVELVEDGSAPEPITSEASAPVVNAPISKSQTATAQYDYEAAEDNELSFPEGAKITNVEFPDDDWWSGEYNGAQGLFPANYVELDKS